MNSGCRQAILFTQPVPPSACGPLSLLSIGLGGVPQRPKHWLSRAYCTGRGRGRWDVRAPAFEVVAGLGGVSSISRRLGCRFRWSGHLTRYQRLRRAAEASGNSGESQPSIARLIELRARSAALDMSVTSRRGLRLSSAYIAAGRPTRAGHYVNAAPERTGGLTPASHAAGPPSPVATATWTRPVLRRLPNEEAGSHPNTHASMEC